MSARRRVAVTGVGVITPIGIGEAALWDGLRAQRSAVGGLTRFDPSVFRSHLAAEINDFVPTDHLEFKRAKRLDRFGQFSVVAARLALEGSGIDLATEDRERVGAMMGTALGGIGYAEEQLGNFLGAGLRAVDPLLALSVFGGASSCNIAIEFGLYGPNSTNAMSCASGAMAIGDAFRQVRDGYADVMLGGGAEAPLAPLTFGAFALIRVLSQRNDDPATASRPFDRDRDGFVMGEAAAVLVLEERGAARRRGAPIVAELLGFGASNDAYHMTAPRPDGREAARAVRAALDDAKVTPERIGYVNAHGSSTPLNEVAEARALHAALGPGAANVPVSGTKGLYGHALGASGAVEAAITALALHHGLLPGTCNLATPDPEIDLCVLAEPRAGRVEVALSTSFGFGGMNAALVLGQAPDS